MSEFFADRPDEASATIQFHVGPDTRIQYHASDDGSTEWVSVGDWPIALNLFITGAATAEKFASIFAAMASNEVCQQCTDNGEGNEGGNIQ